MLTVLDNLSWLPSTLSSLLTTPYNSTSRELFQALRVHASHTRTPTYKHTNTHTGTHTGTHTHTHINARTHTCACVKSKALKIKRDLSLCRRTNPLCFIGNDYIVLVALSIKVAHRIQPIHEHVIQPEPIRYS